MCYSSSSADSNSLPIAKTFLQHSKNKLSEKTIQKNPMILMKHAEESHGLIQQKTSEIGKSIIHKKKMQPIYIPKAIEWTEEKMPLNHASS